LQNEAALLKNVQSGGRQTKIVVLGIGSSASERELNATASSPSRSNVIRVQDFTTLMTVRDQLRDTSCTRTCMTLLLRKCAVYSNVRWTFFLNIPPRHCLLPHSRGKLHELCNCSSNFF